jgi:hypothetical protein
MATRWDIILTWDSKDSWCYLQLTLKSTYALQISVSVTRFIGEVTGGPDRLRQEFSRATWSLGRNQVCSQINYPSCSSWRCTPCTGSRFGSRGRGLDLRHAEDHWAALGWVCRTAWVGWEGCSYSKPGSVGGQRGARLKKLHGIWLPPNRFFIVGVILSSMELLARVPDIFLFV